MGEERMGDDFRYACDTYLPRGRAEDLYGIIARGPPSDWLPTLFWLFFGVKTTGRGKRVVHPLDIPAR